MGTFTDFRRSFPEEPHTRGTEFERVCKIVLETAPTYRTVCVWDDWPQRWGSDCGIDLMAQDTNGNH